MGITPVEITPDLTPVEITPVDSPPLAAVKVCSIFEDDAISIIAIVLPSTPTRKVLVAGDKRFYNSLGKDENMLDNIDLLDNRGIN